MTDLATKDRVISANGRDYRWPKRPTVVVCIDGSEPGYIEAAIAKGMAPNFARLMETGANLTALSAMPSFTNPNNISIITGTPPAVHGIAGNFFYDPETGTEVMMNDARFMRTGTIMAAFHDAGARVAMVTAKDKLRTLLAKGLDVASGRAVAFSAEKADQATMAENGIDDLLQTLGRPLPPSTRPTFPNS
jgi:phosphonoacetate hydrolase